MGDGGLGLLQSLGPGGASTAHKVLRWGTSLAGRSCSLLAEKDGEACKEAGVLSTIAGFCLLHFEGSWVWT